MLKLKQLSKTDVSECDVMMYSAITQWSFIVGKRSHKDNEVNSFSSSQDR